MGVRHEAIGIKQVIRLEWMQHTTNLVLAGLSVESIRQELHEYLSGRKGGGTEGERGQTSRAQVVNMLVKIWVSPDPELLQFRDSSLAFVRESPPSALAVHWCMMSAAYPFWFNVARQTGRLLALQNKVTQPQIINRLKEQYGDRQTVSRYARSAIRSFVAWGVLRDSNEKGCYEKSAPIPVTDRTLAVLLIESALHTTGDRKSSLGLLLNSPAFFPFQLSAMSGNFLSQHTQRIDVVRYGLDEELLRLKES